MGNCHSFLQLNNKQGHAEIIIPEDLIVYIAGKKETKALRSAEQTTTPSLRERYIAAPTVDEAAVDEAPVKRLTRSKVAAYLQALGKEEGSGETETRYSWTSLLAPGSYVTRNDVGFEAVSVVYALALTTLKRAQEVASDASDETADSLLDPVRYSTTAKEKSRRLTKPLSMTRTPAWEKRRERVQQLLIEAAEELVALRDIRNTYYPNADAASALPLDLQDAVLGALIHQCLGQAEMLALVRRTRSKIQKARNKPLQDDELSDWVAWAHSAMNHFEEALTLLDEITPADLHWQGQIHGERFHAWIEYLRFRLRTSTAWARCLQGISIWSGSSVDQQARGAALAAFQDGFDTLEAARRHVHKSWCGRWRIDRERVLTALTALEVQFMKLYEPIAKENMRLYLVGRGEQPPALPPPQALIAELEAWPWQDAVESTGSVAPQTSFTNMSGRSASAEATGKENSL
ncbi:hypothetical protein F1559_003743 [Cyanidiococcus yangmingshanensis]|uniref:Uncharacterized protein n=1 Tax=Cyanidiococcus yangmingshanensis TaxID=2690220 RepID=A0A7J7IFS9_9RHOD|nr:hypothetical protein F1559_003743 [Cyanidiococcus yangmingshanensis]